MKNNYISNTYNTCGYDEPTHKYNAEFLVWKNFMTNYGFYNITVISFYIRQHHVP